MKRSKSLHDRLEILKQGTLLYKIRDKGLRGINVYKRTFKIDLENLLIHFSPHNDKSFVCGASGIEYYFALYF